MEEFLFLLSLSTNSIPLPFSLVVFRESDTPGAFRGKERSQKEIKNEDSSDRYSPRYENFVLVLRRKTLRDIKNASPWLVCD
jgi:hypothetical protein